MLHINRCVRIINNIHVYTHISIIYIYIYIHKHVYISLSLYIYIYRERDVFTYFTTTSCQYFSNWVSQ